MLARVSQLEAFRRWEQDEEQDVDAFRSYIFLNQPSEPMLAGTAFHRCLETIQPGEFSELSADGFTFIIAGDLTLPVCPIREIRAYKRYGDIEVTGQLDAEYGKRVEDHKTTGYFNADKYLEGYQWRFYLDMFDADTFRWNVFPLVPVRGRERTYEVREVHHLEQCRYPGMHEDCMDLAERFRIFASIHLPELNDRTI
jgi:hypothetical protein